MSLTIQPFNSLSSALILGITVYRNQGNGNKCLAQAGYVLTTAVAIIETIAASVFCLATVPLKLSSYSLNKKMVVWLGSSFFSIGWSVVSFFLNPFCDRMVGDEISARVILSSGNLMRYPEGSIIHIYGHNFLSFM